MAVDVVTLRKASVEFGLRMNCLSVPRDSRETSEKPVMKKRLSFIKSHPLFTCECISPPSLPPLFSNVITVELKHLRFQLSTVHHNWEC